MRVLAGDIGGTTTRLAMVEVGDHKPSPVLERDYSSTSHPDLQSIVNEFLQSLDSPKPLAACFAVAGPVRDGRAQITNLPWVVDAQDLQDRFSIGPVSVINDLQAVSSAVPFLDGQDLQVLQEGSEMEHGVKVVIAAGTGLGEGFLTWNGHAYDSFPSEGGHVDFAPRSAQQAELLASLHEQHDHVSYERLVSGPGLENIYAFLCGPAAAREHADVISTRALDGSDPLAVRALEMFVDVYGAQAGNLALTNLATGGVYIAGGIAPKILPKLIDGNRFINAFRDKGRMRSVLEAMPVAVIVHPEPGLIGAAATAAATA